MFKRTLRLPPTFPVEGAAQIHFRSGHGGQEKGGFKGGVDAQHIEGGRAAKGDDQHDEGDEGENPAPSPPPFSAGGLGVVPGVLIKHGYGGAIAVSCVNCFRRMIHHDAAEKDHNPGN